MQTLELECPACGELLELDMGFAGGVCRCSACGTLMTVPQDAAQGAQAEQLSRPDRPDDPSGFSGMSDAAADSAPPRSGERGTGARRPSSRAGQRGGKRQAKGKGRGKNKPRGRSSARSGERIEQGVYTTASGKTVQIDRAMDVPTAETRRTGVRVATAAVFFSIVLAVTILGAVAIIWMLQHPKGGKPDTDDDDIVVVDDPTQFTYLPSANPFTIEQPNAVGLPISGTVAIIFETDPSNADWLEPMAEMLGTGLNQPGSQAEVLILSAGPGGVRAFREQPVVPATVTPALLSSFVTETGSGDGEMADAIDRALRAEPTMLILVCGQPSSTDVLTWDQRLLDYPQTEVYGVLVSGFSPTFQDWVNDRDGGRFINLTASEIKNWREDWAEETESDEE